MKFETALNRTARDDIIYISIGSNVPNSATQEKITTQQLPKYIKSAAGKGKKASVILIDNGFKFKEPNIFTQYIKSEKGRYKSDKKDTFYANINTKNFVTIRTVADLFTTRDEQYLIDYIRKNKNKTFIIGDFRVVKPWEPFTEEGAINLGKLVKLKNVILVDDYKKEVYRA